MAEWPARDPGYPDRRHDLWHGAATQALAGGAGLKTVSELLGHSTITADTYASVLPEVAHGAAEAAGRLSCLYAHARHAERASLQGFAFRVIR
jgi:integrase